MKSKIYRANIDFIDNLLQSPAVTAREISKVRGDFLLRPGQTERYCYLVLSGALRVFFTTETEEHTVRLAYEGSILTSLTSFLRRVPSEFSVQALRKCRLLAVSHRDFMAFAHADADNLRGYCKLLEQLITQQIERENDLLHSSPAERYRLVQERSPRLFQEIPAKYIAAYLRMTPETLSRISKS